MSNLEQAIVFVSMAVSLAGVVLPRTQAQIQPPATEVAKPEIPYMIRDVRSVFFRVVDQQSRQPLPAVTLKVWINGKIAGEHPTDDSGRRVIPVPDPQPDRLTVTARGEGLVPRKVYLRYFPPRPTEIPRLYTLAMERGTSIGGIVRDEQGRPIEGAAVELYDADPDDRAREALDFDGVSARTDSQGRWRLDLVPSGLDLARLRFHYSHPEFLNAIDTIKIQPKHVTEQLRARSREILLRRGISVTGRVLDRGGRPIRGASVGLGLNFRDTATQTDVDGRFRIRNASAGDTFLTVRAAGHAVEVTPVLVRYGLSPVEFRLGSGRSILGRVVDSKGQPVAGAGVYAALWGGRCSLDWQTQTDAKGRFGWESAPSEQVTLRAIKQGYHDAVLTLEPSNKEPVLTLVKLAPLRIRGTVTDDASGRPIEDFTVVPGNEQLWFVNFAVPRQNSRYELSPDPQGIGSHRVRIEARGYLPAVSPLYEPGAGEQVFDARLKKGAWLEGLVRGPDRAPLAEAEVIVVTGGGISVNRDAPTRARYHPHMVTAAGGRFSFSPPDGPYRILALHDRGYAEASAGQCAQAHGLTIEPWGRIEGTLRVGGQFLANKIVIATLDDERPESENLRIWNDNQARTDENGHFVIERVAPGEARVHLPRDNDRQRTIPDRYYQPTFVNVVPGRTARAELVEEGGRPLLGRVVDPGSDGGPLDLVGSGVYVFPKVPAVPYPPGVAEQNRSEWLRKWRLSPAGSAYRHQRRVLIRSLRLQPDGSFRVDEVQPGGYQMRVRVRGFAELTRDVTVPESGAGRGGSPVDLGNLTLTRQGNPGPGH